MDYKRIFKNKENENVFIKKTIPVTGSAEKAVLNRKGNVIFNSGDFETARRIFMTTGYTDGLARVGDHYSSKDQYLDALRMYWIAPDRTKAEPIIIKLSHIIQSLIKEDQNNE